MVSVKPAAERVTHDIREQIRSGQGEVGSTTPSTRDLPRHYGVSPNTVMAAFRTLEAERYVETRGRRGRFVLDATRRVRRDVEVRESQVVLIEIAADDSLVPTPNDDWGTQIIHALKRTLLDQSFGLTAAHHLVGFECQNVLFVDLLTCCYINSFTHYNSSSTLRIRHEAFPQL